MIRRNILTDDTAREEFIRGVHLLKQQPWTNDGLGIFDFFVFWHHRAMMLATPSPPVPANTRRNAAHSGPIFLPWHRYMLLMLEFFLRQALGNDDFRIPYWNWTADADDPSASPIWSPQVLGGTGNPVGSGRFQRFGPDGLEWEVRLIQDPFSGELQRVSRGMRRNLGAQGFIPDTDDARDAVQNRPLYDTFPWDDNSIGSFRRSLEGLHNVVHVWVGGDMVISTSPNDPAFYLHHCNVDRLWRAWQEQHGITSYVPDQSAPEWLAFHRLQDRMHTFFDHTVTAEQVLNSDAFYTYDTLAV